MFAEFIIVRQIIQNFFFVIKAVISGYIFQQKRIFETLRHNYISPGLNHVADPDYTVRFIGTGSYFVKARVRFTEGPDPD